jgi:hypothetical protein
MLRWIGGWLAASLATYVTGSIVMTQVVLADVTRFGVIVDLPARLSMSFADVAGLVTSYLPLIAIAMAVALLIAGFLGRLVPARRSALILLAGVTAPPALIAIMTLTFGMNPLAGAAGVTGLVLQAFAGLAGGLVFLRVVGLRGHGR